MFLESGEEGTPGFVGTRLQGREREGGRKVLQSQSELRSPGLVFSARREENEKVPMGRGNWLLELSLWSHFCF